MTCILETSGLHSGSNPVGLGRDAPKKLSNSLATSDSLDLPGYCAQILHAYVSNPRYRSRITSSRENPGAFFFTPPSSIDNGIN
jgi:hypothetical protein